MQPTDILINFDIIHKHKKDFLTYMLCLFTCNQEINWTNSQWRCGEIGGKADIDLIARTTGLTKQTIYKHIRTFDDNYCYAGPMGIIPMTIWNRLLQEVDGLGAAAKNGLVRTFCYLVMQCWSFQQFSRSEVLMARELGTNLKDTIARINWLVKHGFIAVRRPHRHFKNTSVPRIYSLYRDEVPAYYAGSNWFANNLTERDNESLDDILVHFKNSFEK